MNRLLQNLKTKLALCYGLDQLSLALLLFGCLLTVVISFFRVPYYRFIGLLPMLIALWRTLSKNREKRYAENARFLQLWNPLRQWFLQRWSRLRDRAHCYYACPTCKRTLRVPRGRGKIEITCPHCGTKFKKRT